MKESDKAGHLIYRYRARIHKLRVLLAWSTGAIGGRDVDALLGLLPRSNAGFALVAEEVDKLGSLGEL